MVNACTALNAHATRWAAWCWPAQQQLVRYFVVERGVFQSQPTLISGLSVWRWAHSSSSAATWWYGCCPSCSACSSSFDSLGRIQNALELRRCEYSSWKIFLLLAVLSVVLGIVMVVDPGTMEMLVMAIGLILILKVR